MASMLTAAADLAMRKAAAAEDTDAIRALNAIATAARLLSEAEALILAALPTHANHLPDVAACLHDMAGDVAGHYAREAA